MLLIKNNLEWVTHRYTILKNFINRKFFSKIIKKLTYITPNVTQFVGNPEL